MTTQNPPKERPVMASFYNRQTGKHTILYDDDVDPESVPPSPTRTDELRAARTHLKQAAAALRRAIGDGPGPQTRKHA
jgi:hypothetical protein